MIKHLQKVGNSSALIFDKVLMDLIGLEENGDVQITVHNGSLIITPANPKTVEKEYLQKSLDKLVAERGAVFKRLADE